MTSKERSFVQSLKDKGLYEKITVLQVGEFTNAPWWWRWIKFKGFVSRAAFKIRISLARRMED